MRIEIYPAILAHTFEEYANHLSHTEAIGVTWAQIDIMDGRFVPARSVLPAELLQVKTTLALEAHLMVYEPALYFEDLVSMGVRRVLLHRESFPSLAACNAELTEASAHFPEVGLVLNPETPVEAYAGLPIQSVQCMGVQPGASGQPLLPDVYATINAVRSQDLGVTLAADGGIREDNIGELRRHGVTRFVLASALFAPQGPSATRVILQQLMQLATVGGV